MLSTYFKNITYKVSVIYRTSVFCCFPPKKVFLISCALDHVAAVELQMC